MSDVVSHGDSAYSSVDPRSSRVVSAPADCEGVSVVVRRPGGAELARYPSDAICKDGNSEIHYFSPDDIRVMSP